MVSEKLISLCFESGTNNFNGIHTVYLSPSTHVNRFGKFDKSKFAVTQAVACHCAHKLIDSMVLWTHRGMLAYCIILHSYYFDEFYIVYNVYLP